MVAIDADINQQLADALGAGGEPPALGALLPQISSAAAMVKTTPPGRGSRLLRLGGDDPVHATAVANPCGARLMATGPFSDDDIGVACYHAKTGAVELYLNHLVDRPREYVVVDCTAGGIVRLGHVHPVRPDLPGLRARPQGAGVYRQWAGYAADYDVPLAVVGNKIEREGDIAFLREHVGPALLTCIGHAPAVRAMEQSRLFVLDDLGQDTRTALGILQDAVDARVRDWPRFMRQAADFYPRNARAWANAAAGEDLAAQIDPEFVIAESLAAWPP